MYRIWNFYNLFGNETANPFEPSGWNTFIESNRLSGITGGATTVPSTLKFLDDMIDLSNRKGGQGTKDFAMSPEMLTCIQTFDQCKIESRYGWAGYG